MSLEKSKNIFFLETQESLFEIKAETFSVLFKSFEKSLNEQNALKLIYKNNYDAVICDMSQNILDKIEFMKQIKQMKPEQQIYAFVISKDEDKIGGMIDFGIHSFVLEVEQFDQALEAIAQM